jgi:hypothetical protein
MRRLPLFLLSLPLCAAMPAFAQESAKPDKKDETTVVIAHQSMSQQLKLTFIISVARTGIGSCDGNLAIGSSYGSCSESYRSFREIKCHLKLAHPIPLTCMSEIG